MLPKRSSNAPVPRWLSTDFRHTFFNSETLYYSHVHSVLGTNWLECSIINFYYLFLENVKYASKPELCFVCPNAVFLSRWVTGSDLEDNLTPYDFASRSIIFLPINDSQSIDAPGGSHWSLAVYFRERDEYVLYDSSRHLNDSVAGDYVQRLDRFIYGRPRSRENPLTIIEEAVQQQRNGSDCGVFTLGFTSLICRGYGCQFGVQPRQLREEIVELIRETAGIELENDSDNEEEEEVDTEN